MICKCGETGVLNEVLNQQFYYCRICKIEIPLEEPPSILSGLSKVIYYDHTYHDGVSLLDLAQLDKS